VKDSPAGAESTPTLEATGRPGVSAGCVETDTVADPPLSTPARSGTGIEPDRRPARYDRRSRPTPTLTVIVPTYNEAENIPILIKLLQDRLADFDYEVVIVDDDSPDQTWRVALDAVTDDHRFSVIRRTSDRGLSAAVLTGMSMASGSVMVVMDGDLQHDPAAIPALVSKIIDDGAEVCVASRAVEGGSYGEFSSRRRFVSWVGAQMAHLFLQASVTDPMSGFFAISRQRYDAVVNLVNPRGFKILLEFLARGPRPVVAEVGYRFGNRIHGTTKLTGSVVVAYLIALIELSVGRFISATFTAYCLVGLVGLTVRSGVQWLLSVGLLGAAVHPRWAVVLAVQLSIISNYALNNAFTFTSRRHRGWSRVGGLIRFQIVSIYGLFVHAGAMALLVDHSRDEGAWGVAELWSIHRSWPFIIGLGMAMIGNYYLNTTVTWRPRP